MGQAPQTPPSDQPYCFFQNLQALDLTNKMDPTQGYPWVMATIIEDDDLTFGGKPLSTWYEEDRRRYSLGEESAPSPRFEEDTEEEERRGRQRVSLIPPHAEPGFLTLSRQDRPQYTPTPEHKRSKEPRVQRAGEEKQQQS